MRHLPDKALWWYGIDKGVNKCHEVARVWVMEEDKIVNIKIGYTNWRGVWKTELSRSVFIRDIVPRPIFLELRGGVKDARGKFK